MDPIQIIVSALAAGAAAGLHETAAAAIQDAYNGLRDLIARKYSSVDLESLERKPESASKRESVAEDLRDTGAAEDLELLEQARHLIEAVERHDPPAAAAVGVDLAAVKAAYLKVSRVRAEGTGIKVRKSEFEGGIDIDQVRAGKTDKSSGP